ncbi:type-F conjugative transfer system protein TraW [Rhodoferax antarcticus ANT.BR]|uniref:Type-F conjugative transfer system protein TraW n=1 Tax=Rhodoferax antarcticus ANT.BR TaxID=1111071 RepID=A0A1Q8Y918_9BURK|nr:type-F conjugative transfer system protein TraW [Rhodoferax antarcticus ANT.BR]
MLAASVTVHAEDLGVYGSTYEIKERDAIDSFKEAAAKKLANGGKEQMIEGAKDRYLDSLANVKTPDGIHAAKANQIRHVDLSETVKETIKDTNGFVIVAAGTKINPLALGGLSKKLFFIDAKEDWQIDLVRRRSKPEDKIILLGGSIFVAGEKLNRKVYLDVPGLHKRMDIRVLPSIASQDGALLKVEEVKQ